MSRGACSRKVKLNKFSHGKKNGQMGADIYGPVHRKYSIRLNNFHLKNESYELKAAQNFAVLAHHLA